MRVATNLDKDEYKSLLDVNGETIVEIGKAPFKNGVMYIRDMVLSTLSELDKADKLILDFSKGKLTYFYLGYFITKCYRESKLNIIRYINYKNLKEDIRFNRLFTIQFDDKTLKKFLKLPSINVNSIEGSFPFRDVDIYSFVTNLYEKSPTQLKFDIDIGNLSEEGLLNLGILFSRLGYKEKYAINIKCSIVNEESIALSTILPIIHEGEYISEELINKIFSEPKEVKKSESKTKGKQLNEVLDDFKTHEETDITHLDVK